MSCPIIFNSNTIELTVHTSCYWGLRLTLCYSVNFDRTQIIVLLTIFLGMLKKEMISVKASRL